MKRIHPAGLCRLMAALLLAGCGSVEQVIDDSTSIPALAGASALSKHYVEVVFASDVGGQAETPGLYEITAPDGSALQVRAAQKLQSPGHVMLTTSAQSEVEYTLRVAGSSAVITAASATLPAGAVLFKGSSAPEPYVSSAIALDNTTVLVTFNEVMDNNANIAEFYRIESPDLAIFGAAKGALTTVRLTTASQNRAQYTLRVTNVSASNGNKLIDPDKNTASFQGIPPVDNDPPQLLTAAVVSDTKVLLSFSEPLADGQADPVNFSISPGLLVTGAAMSTYNTQVLLTTLPMQAGVDYTVTAAGSLEDRAGNALDPAQNSATFVFRGQTELNGAATLPRVVGAIALSNTKVRVSFSKVMGSGLEDKLNYSITGSETVFVYVLEAIAGADRTYVDLTTSSQAAGKYTVKVVNVKDSSGNPLMAPDGLLAPPEGVDPAAATFMGMPPVINGETGQNDQVDTDGDGIADFFETLGWMVAVKFANGTSATYHVTSDIYSKDTDGDGMSDAEENQWSFDPRSSDSDVDYISDYDEFNVYYSDALNQDSDGDGIGDYLEIFFFRTSALLADTDGDQWPDGKELFERNRNARLADLPVPQIKVGNVGLFLKETFSFTDETGTTQTKERSASTTLSQGTETSRSTSDTTSSESTDKFSQEFGTEFTVGGKDPFGGFKISVEAGFEQTRQRGYSMTVDNSSSQTANQEENKSLTEATAFSENRAVTRNVEDADLTVDVTITNLGDVAFTMTDLELSALVRDPIRRVDVPVATLLPERVLAGGADLSLNLGPFDRERGPFIFKDVQIFPNLVQDLRKSPRNVVIKAANFNIRAEDGRLFAFSSQDVNDRTAGLVIDFGNGTVESYRVATNSSFDENGRAVGITMREALEDIVGIKHAAGEDPLPLPAGTDLSAPAIRKTYGTATDDNDTPDTEDDVEVLTRVRGVQTGTGVGSPTKKFWVVLTSADIPIGTNFSDIPLKAGQNFTLAYVADNDKDGLFASTEFLYGSSDDNPDTDGDGIGDYDEVRTGWLVDVPGNGYMAFSDPTRVDSDGDGLSDPDERALHTDPRSVDTDEDGVSDNDERFGYIVVQFDTDSDPTNNPQFIITPYHTALLVIDGGNGVAETSPADGTDDVLATAGSVITGAGGLSRIIVLQPGPNGIIDSFPGGDDILLQTAGEVAMDGGNATANTTAADDDLQFIALGSAVDTSTLVLFGGSDLRVDATVAGDDRYRAAHRLLFATDPLKPDTDGDGLPDGREQFLGSDPNNPRDAGTVTDTDSDGLTDAEERAGWTVVINGVPSSSPVASDPTKPDSDGDGLPDLLEKLLGLNPILRDSDSDGNLTDRQELDPNDPNNYFPFDAFDEFDRRCALSRDPVIACAFTPADNPVGTNPKRSDTDGDGRTDGAEVNTPWTVTVGQTSTEVYSDPLKADGDLDGLNDAQELTRLTNPNNANTDGDNANDGYEVNTRGTNPLVPDQRVVFTYTTMTATSSCDTVAGFTSHLEFHGNIFVTGPTGSTDISYNFPCRGDRSTIDTTNPPQGYTLPANVSISRSVTYILGAGQSFSVSSDTFQEHDDVTCDVHGLDSSMGTMTATSYTYPVTSQNPSYTIGSSCQITINAQIAVD